MFQVDRRLFSVLVVVIFAVLTGSLAAQQNTSYLVTIQVTDVIGAIISHAQVHFAPAVVNLPYRLEADSDGRLQVDMKSGSYDVSVASPGFAELRMPIEVKSSLGQIVQLHLSRRNTLVDPVVWPEPPIIPTEPVVRTAMLSVEVPAGSLVVSAGPDHSTIFDVGSLKKVPHKTITVHNPHTNTDETYSGVPLIDLLAKEGVVHGHDLRGKGLSEYVVATGSDGYKAVLALAEVDPEFHPGDVIVADAMDGKPIDAKSGPFRLVVTEDKRPARSVHNLVSIELRTAE
jgi:hypothetical protein